MAPSMLLAIKHLVFKLHLILICHFHVDCWQIGDNLYNCDGCRQCEYNVDG
jgi:hypothetical protein